jgi:hypothetical protein
MHSFGMQNFFLGIWVVFFFQFRHAKKFFRHAKNFLGSVNIYTLNQLHLQIFNEAEFEKHTDSILFVNQKLICCRVVLILRILHP